MSAIHRPKEYNTEGKLEGIKREQSRKRDKTRGTWYAVAGGKRGWIGITQSPLLVHTVTAGVKDARVRECQTQEEAEHFISFWLARRCGEWDYATLKEAAAAPVDLAENGRADEGSADLPDQVLRSVAGGLYIDHRVEPQGGRKAALGLASAVAVSAAAAAAAENPGEHNLVRSFSGGEDFLTDLINDAVERRENAGNDDGRTLLRQFVIDWDLEIGGEDFDIYLRLLSLFDVDGQGK